MKTINGLASGCCGGYNRNYPYYGSGKNYPFGRNALNRAYEPGCGCASNFVGRNIRLDCNGYYCGRGYENYFEPTNLGCGCGCGCGCDHDPCHNAEADIQIFCVDKDCNPICDCVYQLDESNGCHETIDLHNCDHSTNIHLPGGCSVLENISAPNGFCRLNGKIYCDVGYDSCGHEVCTVSADKCLDDNLVVRRECGVTIIICKYDREPGSCCDNGCGCSHL